MNIVYILYWVDGPESGVYRKVLNQAKFWKAANHEVTLALAGPADKEQSYTKATTAAGVNLKYFPVSGALGRWLRWQPLKRYLRSQQFDAIYHRFDLATPGLSSAMELNRWVVEINTNDLTEYGLHPGARSFYNRLSRARHFSRAGGSVFPTRELAADDAFKSFNSTREVIPNGGDFANTPVAPLPQAGDPVQLLFIGSDGHAWHGVDKLVALANAKPDWQIHAVGVSEARFPGGRPPNVLTPGRLTKPDYERVASRCVVGIGSLALHRLQMDEACPLKVREYLAIGLPVILGCIDTDIPPNAPYALQLPNVEENVATNLDRIVAFVESWRGRRVPRTDVAHMDWAVKEQQRLKFMSRFARRS